MKKNLLLTVLIMSFSLLLISFANASKNTLNTEVSVVNMPPADSSIKENEVSLSYALVNKLHLEEAGLSSEAVAYAVNGYEKLQAEGKVTNPLLTIVDMSQSSRRKRFYVLDMEKQELVWNTYVSHGKNSGVDMAERFSNQFNSEASSLGFYITTSTYNGKHGLSLRISGQEEGFNDNAEARGVVVHGAAYVNAARANSAYMGRSQGCPALPQNEYAKVINIIKGGSVLFVYAPESNYLQSSQLIKS